MALNIIRKLESQIVRQFTKKEVANFEVLYVLPNKC